MAALVLFSSAGMPAAQEEVTKYLVHVRLSSLDRVAELAAAGFDVAGVNKAEFTAGVVATDEDLKRLRDLGFAYTLERTNKDPESILALQDYTDPVEMSAFLDQVVAAYPNLVQKFVVAGPFFDGQTQYALKITKDVGQDNGRPSFVLDSQVHAREVMTAEIAKDMIEYLTSRYATDPQVQRWVDNINIYVVPNHNPDGAMYVFQHDNMWRKNRRPACPVDINRNYPFAWGSCNGSSGVCTDETNRGTEPGSEPETQGMLQLFSSTHSFFSLSYHSYGEYLMYSYGCTNPDEMTAMDEVADSLNAVLQNDSGQTPFAVPSQTGPIWSSIYQVDGGSIDSDYALYGTYAYTIEVNTSSFQPDYATWRNITVQRQRTAWQFFLNRTLDGPQIRGTVTDLASGLPVAARTVVQEVTYTHGETARRADAKGHYYFLGRSGQTYHVTFSSPGYCTITQAATVGSGPATLDAAIVKPTPPGLVTAVGAGDNQIDVSWSPTLNATEYHILRSLNSGGPYAQVGTVAAPTTVFHDTGVSGTATYYYVVHSLQPCESLNSAEAGASTTGACFVGPAFAGIFSISNPQTSTCSLSLSWTAAATRCGGSVTYKVHRSTTPSFTPDGSNVIASGLGTTSYTDHDALADGTTYYYVVRAVDASNGSDDGNVKTLSGSPTGETASGTWTDDAGDTGTAALVLSSPWTVLPTGGKTGPKVYATGTYANNLCAALTTPTLSVQSNAVLTFASKYDIETNWDAGIVEVAQGPTFSTWSRLTTVNYADALQNTGNACGFPKSVTGTVFSHYYTPPTYRSQGYTGSLAAYAGTDIKLRWRISSDLSGAGTGWWVDDIAVTNVVFRQVCAAGSAANPKEASPDGSPMTASRAATGTGVNMTYAPGCGTLENAVYWGTWPIAPSPNWTNAACSVGNTGQASFDPGDPSPGGGLFYFVIVGQNATKEGSYGMFFDGVSLAERPEAVGIGACDKPQDLTGVCP